jgi:hypothetical protein
MGFGNSFGGDQSAPPTSMPANSGSSGGPNSKPQQGYNGEGSFFGDLKRGKPQPITPDQRLKPEPRRR